MWKRWVTDTHCVTIRFRNNKTKSKCGRFGAIKMTHFLCCSMIRLKYCHQLEFFYFLYTVGDIIWQMFQQKHPSIFLYIDFVGFLFVLQIYTPLAVSEDSLFFWYSIGDRMQTQIPLNIERFTIITFQTESKIAGQPNFVDLTLLKMDMLMVFHFNAFACHVFDCLPLVCNSSYSMVNVSYFI